MSIHINRYTVLSAFVLASLATGFKWGKSNKPEETWVETVEQQKRQPALTPEEEMTSVITLLDVHRPRYVYEPLVDRECQPISRSAVDFETMSCYSLFITIPPEGIYIPPENVLFNKKMIAPTGEIQVLLREVAEAAILGTYAEPPYVCVFEEGKDGEIRATAAGKLAHKKDIQTAASRH